MVRLGIYVKFNAKSIKHIMPITWSQKFYQDFHPLAVREHEHGRSCEPPPEQVLPSAKPSLQCPSSGPPVDWIRGEGGFTEDCIACRGLKEKGTRKGLVHPRPCCMRYEKFLKDQAAGHSGLGDGSLKQPSEHVELGVLDDLLSRLRNTMWNQTSGSQCVLMMTTSHWHKNQLRGLQMRENKT